MTLELRCGDVIAGCGGVVTGDTHEQVMDLAARHAAVDHGLTDVDAETRAALAAAVHDADAVREG